MQTHGGTAAADAITASERYFKDRLLVDWNNNGLYDHALSDMTEYVQKSARDQALTSTAPDELMLIEGYAAASLDIEVTGEYDGLSLVAHFAPYNGRSAFYAEGLSLGIAMTYEIAVWTDEGWVWYPQFTGIVREVELNREDDRVTLHCLDNVEKMRKPVQVPPYAMYKDYLINGFKRAQLVDSSSLIDLAARSAGFSNSPVGWLGWDMHPGYMTSGGLYKLKTILDVPFHGSHLPARGFFDNAFEFHLTEPWSTSTDPALKNYAEQFRDGPHGYLALNATPKGQEAYGYKNYWCDFSGFEHDDDPWGTTFLSAWIYWPGPTGSGVPNRSTDVIRLHVQNADLNVRVESWDGGLNGYVKRLSDGVELWGNWSKLPSTPGWYLIGASFDLSSSTDTRIRTWIGATHTAARSVGWVYGPVSERDINGLVSIRNHYATSDVQVFRSSWNTSLDNLELDRGSHQNAAVSWGRNRITYTLREEIEAWDLAKDVAAAEYGAVFFDEGGKFTFWTYDDVTSKHAAVAKELSIDDVTGLSLKITMDSVRNTWQVTSRTGFSDFGIVYDMRENDVPFTRVGNNSYHADFRAFANGVNGQPQVFWVQDGPNVMCPQPNNLRSAEALPWNDYWPHIDYKPFTGTTYQNVNVSTWIRKYDANWTQLKVWNGLPWAAGDANTLGFVGPNDIRYFRIGGTYITEDPERTWTYSTSDRAREVTAAGGTPGQYAQSIARYGKRAIELGSKWVQDEFQTREMLKNVIERYGRPTPVTDAITVPGDPRIQLGDCIDITDPDGLGGTTRLQILGINRELENGAGLRDTYQVEVIERPGNGLWDDPQYGLWNQSLIWS